MAKKRKTKAEKEAETLTKEVEVIEKEAEVIEKEVATIEKGVESEKEDVSSKTEKKSTKAEKKSTKAEKKEDPKPLAYPTMEQMEAIENPYLLKYSGKVFTEQETSYIKVTLSKWLYSAKGVDKRASQLDQADFDEALKEASFKKRIPQL